MLGWRKQAYEISTLWVFVSYAFYFVRKEMKGYLFEKCIGSIVNFIGIKSLGHSSFSLISSMLLISSENGWDKTIEINNDELLMRSGIGSDATLRRCKKQLQMYKLIKFREPARSKANDPIAYTLLFENMGVSIKSYEEIKKQICHEGTPN